MRAPTRRPPTGASIVTPGPRTVTVARAAVQKASGETPRAAARPSGSGPSCRVTWAGSPAATGGVTRPPGGISSPVVLGAPAPARARAAAEDGDGRAPGGRGLGPVAIGKVQRYWAVKASTDAPSRTRRARWRGPGRRSRRGPGSRARPGRRRRCSRGPARGRCRRSPAGRPWLRRPRQPARGGPARPGSIQTPPARIAAVRAPAMAGSVSREAALGTEKWTPRASPRRPRMASAAARSSPSLPRKAVSRSSTRRGASASPASGRPAGRPSRGAQPHQAGRAGSPVARDAGHPAASREHARQGGRLVQPVGHARSPGCRPAAGRSPGGWWPRRRPGSSCARAAGPGAGAGGQGQRPRPPWPAAYREIAGGHGKRGGTRRDRPREASRR